MKLSPLFSSRFFFSGYGDQNVQTLQAMADNEGRFDEVQLLEHYCKYFGDPNSPYQVSLKIRGDWKKSTSALPVEGPWIQKAVIKMMDSYKKGEFPTGAKDAYEHDGLVAFLPLIIQQSPALDHEKLLSAFKLSTQFPFALGHHIVEAELLSKYIEGSEDPINDVKEIFKNMKNSKANDLPLMVCKEIMMVEDALAKGMNHQMLVRKFGMACELPGSFMSSLVSIIRAKNYADGIRETIYCAGALGARSNFVGAVLGAKYGIESIPNEWISRVEGIEDIIENALKVFVDCK